MPVKPNMCWPLALLQENAAFWNKIGDLFCVLNPILKAEGASDASSLPADASSVVDLSGEGDLVSQIGSLLGLDDAAEASHTAAAEAAADAKAADVKALEAAIRKSKLVCATCMNHHRA